MNNWMQKYEIKKDEMIEKNLNYKLNKLLDLLDEQYNIEERIKIIEKIVNIYYELIINACDYDERDYILKRKQLQQEKYEILKLKYTEDKESLSWEDYKKEELEEEDER